MSSELTEEQGHVSYPWKTFQTDADDGDDNHGDDDFSDTKLVIWIVFFLGYAFEPCSGHTHILPRMLQPSIAGATTSQQRCRGGPKVVGGAGLVSPDKPK